jgi:hypothetical protein
VAEVPAAAFDERAVIVAALTEGQVCRKCAPSIYRSFPLCP